MSENKLRNREVIDAELQKTKAELAIAKHRQAKLRNQIKGMTEKERRHRNIVWGSHFEYLIRERLNIAKEQLAALNDDSVKDILNTLFSDSYFRRTMQNILTEKVNPQSPTEMSIHRNYLPKRGGRHYKTLWADKGCSLAFI